MVHVNLSFCESLFGVWVSSKNTSKKPNKIFKTLWPLRFVCFFTYVKCLLETMKLIHYCMFSSVKSHGLKSWRLKATPGLLDRRERRIRLPHDPQFPAEIQAHGYSFFLAPVLATCPWWAGRLSLRRRSRSVTLLLWDLAHSLFCTISMGVRNLPDCLSMELAFSTQCHATLHNLSI